MGDVLEYSGIFHIIYKYTCTQLRFIVYLQFTMKVLLIVSVSITIVLGINVNLEEYVGQSYTFSCNQIANGSYLWSRIRNGQQINIEDNERFTYPYPDRWQLQINPVREEDRGIYQCFNSTSTLLEEYYFYSPG